MYTYHTTLINKTAGFYFDSLIVSSSFMESEEGTITGTIELPMNLYVLNRNNRPVNYAFTTGQLLTTYKPIKVVDSSTLIKSIKIGGYYEYRLLTPKAVVVPNYERLLFNKPYNNEFNNLINYFKINDVIEVLIEKYQNGNVVESLRRIVNITNLSKTSVITLTVEGESYKLKKLPISISTKPDKYNLLTFLESFIIYYILRYSDVDVIRIPEVDYNTFKNSNMGAYRSNICNFDFLLNKLFKEYNINFIYNTQNGNQLFITYSNTQLSDITLINSLECIAESDLKQIDNNSKPVIIRATSLASTEAVAKLNKTQKNVLAEVIYGDIEALSNDGSIINLKLANLTKDALTELAKKQYIRQKYLFNVNSIVSKKLLNSKSVINYYDLNQEFNIGYYYIIAIQHTYNLSNGYSCDLKLGVRFNNINDLNQVTK